MITAFDGGLQDEAASFELTGSYYDAWFGSGKWSRIGGTDRAEMFVVQSFGDIIGPSRNRRPVLVEQKADFHGLPNIFLETISNSDGKGRAGWMYTSMAHWLVYVYMKERQLFRIDMRRLQDWAIRDGGLQGVAELQVCPKGRQHNKTHGCAVPMTVIRDNVGIAEEMTLTNGGWVPTFTIKQKAA